MNEEKYTESSVMLRMEKGGFQRVMPVGRCDNSNITWICPSCFGTGTFVKTCLPSGLTLTVSHCKSPNGFYAQLQDIPDDIFLIFGLNGRSVNKNTVFKQGFEVEAGNNYIYWFSDSKLIREVPRDVQLDNVVLTIPRHKFFNSGLIGNNTKYSSQEELPSLLGNNTEFFLQKNINSLLMGRALKQIIHCPFSGQIREFFLEAKALELIALKLDMISGTLVTPEGMSDTQMQRVLVARDLLLKDIQNPPSVHELTRAAGMSHPVLSKYFRIVFGCTPFKLLQRERLQWAYQLVGENELSLTEIAYAVGYSNASHFSKAFSDYYGIPPRQYRKEKNGNPFYSLPAASL